jgi:transposase-like protein
VTDIKVIWNNDHEDVQAKCPKCKKWNKVTENQVNKHQKITCEHCGKQFKVEEDNDIKTHIEIGDN